jgi:cation diffusion facilitator CzcD-associated flavoprotein CzcO
LDASRASLSTRSDLRFSEMAIIQKPDEHRFCIIVGAGISGIIQSCEFVRNKILPLEEFEIIDRNGDYGGVWWQNTYPGAACDIPSHVYSISWAANPCKFEPSQCQSLKLMQS